MGAVLGARSKCPMSDVVNLEVVTRLFGDGNSMWRTRAPNRDITKVNGRGRDRNANVGRLCSNGDRYGKTRLPISQGICSNHVCFAGAHRNKGSVGRDAGYSGILGGKLEMARFGDVELVPVGKFTKHLDLLLVTKSQKTYVIGHGSYCDIIPPAAWRDSGRSPSSTSIVVTASS